MEQVAWIGTGVMGAQQAGHLVRAGYPVKAYGHHFEKVEAQARSLVYRLPHHRAQAVADADFIFCDGGLPQRCGRGLLCPGRHSGKRKARRHCGRHDHLQSHPGPKALCPGCRKGYCGAGRPRFPAATKGRAGGHPLHHGGRRRPASKKPPLLEQMGKNILLMGPAGCGQHTKAANQIAVAGATAAYTEAILYAEKQGSTRKKCWTPSAAGRRAAGRSPTWRPGPSWAILRRAFL